MINTLLQWNRLRSLLGRSEAYLLEKRVAEIEDNWKQAYNPLSPLIPQSYRQFVMAFGYPTIAIDGDCCLGFLPAYEAIRITKYFNISGACLFAVCSPQENIYVGFTRTESGQIAVGIYESGQQIGLLDSFEQWLAEQVQFFLRLIVAIPVEELQNLEQGLHHNDDPLGIMTQQLPLHRGRVSE